MGIEEIGTCFEHVEEDWKNCKDVQSTENVKIMRKNAKIGRSFSIICAICMYSGGFLYNILMPLTFGILAAHKVANSEFKSENSSVKLSSLKPFPNPPYEGLFNVHQSPTYEIFFILHVIAAYVSFSITIGLSSIAAVFVMHICGQLEIVMALLRNLVDDQKEETNKKEIKPAVITTNDKLKVNVQHHLRALR